MPTFDALFDEVAAEQSAPAQNFDALFDAVDSEEKEQTAANVQKFAVEAPQQAIRAMEIALPVGLAVQNRLQRKEALQEATTQARREGALSRAAVGVTGLAEQTAEALTPAGIMNQPARLLGKPDVYQPGAPLIQIPRNPALEGTAAGGVANVAFGAIESMTTPEMIVTAPAMAASALARGAMAFEMARNIPEQVAQSAQTLATPESTAQEKVEAVGGPLLSGLFAGLLARGHVTKPKEIPQLRGRALEQPAGARMPRIEAPESVQRVEPAQAEQAARMMQRTATAAYEAPRMPRATVPEYNPPLAEQGRPAGEVIDQPAAPVNGPVIRTFDEAVEALKARGKGNETRAQIQALMPEIQLTREAAGDLARSAFGENWKPGGEARAPGPKPIEGLTAEQQAIADKARTTTMTAEERALSEQMLSGQLDKPSEAPQAPVVERPSERIEVQRQGEEKGSETVTPPQNRPAIESEARIETEAPKAPEPVQPAPLTASMESARQVAAMTPAEFAQRAKSFNKTNLELGQKVSDAELAELEQLGIQAEQRWTQAKRRAQTEKTPEAMDEMMALSSMPQYFNEAIAEARRIRERTPNVAESERRVSSGESPNRPELRNVPEQGQGPGEVAPNLTVQETIKPSDEPIPAKPETKPVSTATEAAKKVATEVKSVASSEGQRPAKEVKSELVQRLEKALDEATSTTEEHFEGLYVKSPKTLKEEYELTSRPTSSTSSLKGWLEEKRPYKNPSTGESSIVPNRDTVLGRKFIGEALESKGVKKITIEIPGDGTFTIWNTKTAIGELLEKAKRISTKASEPPSVSIRRTSKADKAWIEQTLAEGKKAEEGTKLPKIEGMGGAVQSEFERVTGSPTAMKYADLDADRISRGLEPLTRPESVADAEVQQRAFQAMDRDPAAPEKLISELLDNPRAISDVETHMLLLHRIDIRQERMRALNRARQAYEDSKQFPNRLADVARETTEAERWSNQLERLEKAAGGAATEKGRALRAQRVMMNEDYSLEAMQSRALAARNFRELPPEKAAQELAELTKLAEEHKAKSDALTKRIEELEAEAIMREAQARKAAEPGYHPRVIEMAETYAKKWDERGKKALEELRSIFTSTGEGKLFSGAPIGPEVIDKLAIYGISKLVRGAVDLAKWTDAMVKDIGEGFRPYAEQVWKEANARLEKDLTASESKFGRDANAVKTAIKTGGATAVVTPDSIIARMQRSRAKNPKSNLSTLARKLARLYVEQGVKDRNVLIDKVHEGLKQVDPAITRRGTMETLSGYGEYSMLPKDQVSVILRDLQGQMQQILKLEDMAGGKAPKRTGRERRTPSDEERRLQMRVEEAKRRGGYTVTSPETQLRTALDEVKKRLQNQIADLELQIQTKAKIVKERTPVQEDAETQQLRAKRDELKAQFDEIFSEPMTDAQRLEAWKERTRDRIEEAQGILEGTRQRKPKRSELEMDSEALRLRYDLHQIERQIREREVAEKMANRPTYQKVIGEIGETANTIRALMTSFDFSAPLRQGLILTAAHPVRSAVAFPEMFRAAFSAEKAFGQAEALRNRPNAPLYESSGLYLAEHGGRLSTMEEAFMSRRAEKLPVIGRGIRASQRAYTSYLNRIRADSFDAMVKGLTKDGRGNPAELKAIANFINVATGRGSVAWNQAATTLNTVFFAPRYVASRFEYLAGQPLYKGTARTRKMIVKEYGRFLAGAAAVYALAQAAGGEVGTDPNSGDFGKIKIGNTRIDPMAGLLQATVLASRVGSIYANKLGLAGVPKQKGKPLEIDKVLLNFLRGKLAPVPGLVVSFGKGAYPGGEKVTPANLAGSVFPISWQDIYEATKDQGVPAGLALGILSIFGTGVQTYEQDRR